MKNWTKKKGFWGGILHLISVVIAFYLIHWKNILPWLDEKEKIEAVMLGHHMVKDLAQFGSKQEVIEDIKKIEAEVKELKEKWRIHLREEGII